MRTEEQKVERAERRGRAGRKEGKAGGILNSRRELHFFPTSPSVVHALPSRPQKVPSRHLKEEEGENIIRKSYLFRRSHSGSSLVDAALRCSLASSYPLSPFQWRMTAIRDDNDNPILRDENWLSRDQGTERSESGTASCILLAFGL